MCKMTRKCMIHWYMHYIQKALEKKSHSAYITKTCLYNFDPLKPHFYIVKLGFTGVYIIVHIFAQNYRLWVLFKVASNEAVLTSTHNLCFEQKYEKYPSFWVFFFFLFFFLSATFQFLEVKFSTYLNRRVFVMYRKMKKNFILVHIEHNMFTNTQCQWQILKQANIQMLHYTEFFWTI